MSKSDLEQSRSAYAYLHCRVLPSSSLFRVIVRVTPSKTIVGGHVAQMIAAGAGVGEAAPALIKAATMNPRIEDLKNMAMRVGQER